MSFYMREINKEIKRLADAILRGLFANTGRLRPKRKATHLDKPKFKSALKSNFKPDYKRKMCCTGSKGNYRRY